MATITFKGNPIQTCGSLPGTGTPAPDFTLCNGDLEDIGLASLRGKPLLLNIVPSLDTGVCQASARTFNTSAAGADFTVATVSCDLPFAQGRFCSAENLDNLLTLSCFRSPSFGTDYGVTILDGPLRGLLSRAVVGIDAEGTVVYTEQVPEIAQEPDYQAALNALA